MMAAIESIQCLPFGKKITVHTDSQYLKDGITLWLKNWKKKWMEDIQQKASQKSRFVGVFRRIITKP